MKIITIGGSGFIGTNLITELKQEGNEVVNIDIRPSEVHNGITRQGDIGNTQQLEQVIDQSEWVVLLAAEHRDDVSPREKYYQVNVDGTKKVLEEMDRKGIRKIIFTSSVAVFGLDKENPDEDHSSDPFNDYGKSKWEAEEALRAWYHKDPQNKSLVIIRPTVVFGRGNRGNVYNLLQQIASGKFMMIGNGKNKKSMAYVKNVTAFIRHCLHKNLAGYHVFNYSDKPDLTMNELVAISEKSLGRKILPLRIPYAIGYLIGLMFDVLAFVTRKKLPISAVRIKKFCATTQFSSKYIPATGFKAPYTLDEALKDTITSIAGEKQ